SAVSRSSTSRRPASRSLVRLMPRPPSCWSRTGRRLAGSQGTPGKTSSIRCSRSCCGSSPSPRRYRDRPCDPPCASRMGAHGLRSVQSPSIGQPPEGLRSEEHTSELQSLRHLVCRLLLEKKKKRKGIVQTRIRHTNFCH